MDVLNYKHSNCKLPILRILRNSSSLSKASVKMQEIFALFSRTYLDIENRYIACVYSLIITLYGASLIDHFYSIESSDPPVIRQILLPYRQCRFVALDRTINT